MKVALLVSALLLSGCVTKTVYLTTPLPHPEWPVLPPVTVPELACLADESYGNLLLRETRLRNHALRLEKIIEEHNRAAQP